MNTLSHIVSPQTRAEILSITRRYGLTNVRIFGSVVRGEIDDNSDIDLLVLPGPGFTLFKQAALTRELEALIGRKVDIVSERGLRPRIRRRVLEEAVPL
ncbi:MAG: nucleotidyltransferase domain-containing protein [Deltaproteobacteria bacterium]|nr:nucleotidyltransferase domain-containing protein [Candidatus Zymogenaceae bacterium]